MNKVYKKKKKMGFQKVMVYAMLLIMILFSVMTGLAAFIK
ncbi:MAG: hypothetical protein K0R71_261 [Bacillales bacterium]|jgi:hypothetical protein|nr:hypothetical protein [Bacillales bacterium]